MAVAPLVLEGALAAILELIALDEVVQFHNATDAERGAPYDAAIVTPDFGSEILADVVITLPDTQDCTGHAGHDHRGHLTTPNVSDDVDIRDQREVIDLLDAHVPVGVSRRDRLPGSLGRPPR